jgi:hypothetical protein
LDCLASRVDHFLPRLQNFVLSILFCEFESDKRVDKVHVQFKAVCVRQLLQEVLNFTVHVGVNCFVFEVFLGQELAQQFIKSHLGVRGKQTKEVIQVSASLLQKAFVVADVRL